MGERVKERKIIDHGRKCLRFEDLFIHLEVDCYLYAETEAWIILGYLYNHNSDAVIELTSDYYVVYSIQAKDFDPNNPNHVEYQNWADNYFKHECSDYEIESD